MINQCISVVMMISVSTSNTIDPCWPLRLVSKCTCLSVSKCSHVLVSQTSYTTDPPPALMSVSKCTYSVVSKCSHVCVNSRRLIRSHPLLIFKVSVSVHEVMCLRLEVSCRDGIDYQVMERSLQVRGQKRSESLKIMIQMVFLIRSCLMV